MENKNDDFLKNMNIRIWFVSFNKYRNFSIEKIFFKRYNKAYNKNGG